MKFCFLGGLWRGLKSGLEADGHKVIGIAWEDIIQKNGEADGNNIILGEIKKIKPDVLLVFKGYRFGKRILPSMVEQVNKLGIFTIYQSMDDPHFLDKYIRKGAFVGHTKSYGLVLTCCKGVLPSYRQMGNMNVAVMYPALDQDMWTPEDVPEDQKIDFSIVGSMYGMGGTINREHVVRRMVKEGLSVEVHGPEHWRKPLANLPGVYKGKCAVTKVHHVYNRSRINFGSHIRPDGQQYLNSRVFEVMGTGNFLLNDRVVEIEKIFKEGEEIALYNVDDMEDLVAKVKYYLPKVEDRNRIGLNARKKILAGHTYKDRAKEFVKWAKTVGGK